MACVADNKALDDRNELGAYVLPVNEVSATSDDLSASVYVILARHPELHPQAYSGEQTDKCRLCELDSRASRRADSNSSD